MASHLTELKAIEITIRILAILLADSTINYTKNAMSDVACLISRKGVNQIIDNKKKCFMSDPTCGDWILQFDDATNGLAWLVIY